MDIKDLKAIKEFDCEFGNKITTISGENGTGKLQLTKSYLGNIAATKRLKGAYAAVVSDKRGDNETMSGINYKLHLIICRFLKRYSKEEVIIWQKRNTFG